MGMAGISHKLFLNKFCYAVYMHLFNLKTNKQNVTILAYNTKFEKCGIF